MKKGLIILLTGICLIVNSNFIHGQKSPTRKYVKIIVEGVSNSQHASNLDVYIRNKSGILTSRMDYRTKIYFGVYRSDSGVSINDIKNWIAHLGFETKCSVEGNHGTEKILQLKPSDCVSKDIKSTTTN